MKEARNQHRIAEEPADKEKEELLCYIAFIACLAELVIDISGHKSIDKANIEL